MSALSLKIRLQVERQILSRFVTDALAAGYRLAVSLERGYDLDEMLIGSRDHAKIMEEALAGDECHIFVQPAEGPTVDGNQIVSVGWVYFVYGNDGWDVINDYSVNLESLLTGTNKLAEAIESGENPLLDAAGDLLVACEALLAITEPDEWAAYEPEEQAAFRAARAAIAKAKGEAVGEVAAE